MMLASYNDLFFGYWTGNIASSKSSSQADQSLAVQAIETDIVVLGGGIAGLWLLNQFQRAGHRCLLLEKNQLGGEQTLASQGMIHGGIKYALGGFTTPSSESIATMPSVWRQCLTGKGQLDLSGVNILSDDYYLFSDSSISSRITSFFGSKAIEARVSLLAPDQYQEPFSNSAFKGRVYRLEDLVLDTSSLLQRLMQLSDGSCSLSTGHEVCANQQVIEHIRLGNGCKVKAKHYIFAAGSGNAELLKQAGITSPAMQTRPLHQVLVSHSNLPSLYAHAVSMRSANKPRVTITTHYRASGERVWYLGGNLAETGIDRDESAQIDFARKELASIFPWIDLKDAQWASFRVDRAEPEQSEGLRPDQPFFKQINNLLVCWPTKLTLVPMMADAICKVLAPPIKVEQVQAPLDLPPASISPTPWEMLLG